jgi:hypothetical protein
MYSRLTKGIKLSAFDHDHGQDDKDYTPGDYTHGISCVIM